VWALWTRIHFFIFLIFEYAKLYICKKKIASAKKMKILVTIFLYFHTALCTCMKIIQWRQWQKLQKGSEQNRSVRKSQKHAISYIFDRIPPSKSAPRPPWKNTEGMKNTPYFNKGDWLDGGGVSNRIIRYNQ